MSSAAARPTSALLEPPRPIALPAGACSCAVPRIPHSALAGSAFTIVEDVDRDRRSVVSGARQLALS